MRLILSRIILPVLISVLSALPAVAQQAVDITILHYNDFHAQNVPVSKTLSDEHGEKQKVQVGGSAALKAYVDGIRTTKDNVILLHAGDDVQGTPISSLTNGRSQFELLELIQPDAMTLGNHEFDHGTDNLRSLLSTVTFPIISANLWDKARGAPFVPRYRILRLRGASVGVIGLAPPDLPVLTMRENVRDLDVLDPAIAVRQAIDELGRNFNVNIIIVLSHMGLDADSALAEEVGDIDVIIGGHSHTVLAAPRRVNGTIIAQAGERGQWLGRIDASFDAATGVLLSHHGRLIPTRADLVIPDPVVAAKVAELEALVDAGLSEKIAVLENDWVRVLDGECNIGNWQVDVMRDFAKADVAFQNIGGIRKDMQAGPLTLRDMWEISPFGNEFVTFTVTGAQLLDMLRYQARVSNEFCQVSGLRYRYDFTADADVALRADVAGNPIDSARTYLIATNSYVGGHLHDVFGLPERDIEVSPVLPAAVGRDVFIDYARRQGRISGSTEGRITIIGKRK
jgi:5'-nucleotidase / UDP-sugar diphosphatase